MTVRRTAMLRKALEYYKRQSFYEGSLLIKEAIVESPRDASLWARLAHFKLQMGCMNEHDEAMKRAIRLDSRNAAYYLQAAVATPPLINSIDEMNEIRERSLSRLSQLISASHLKPVEDPLGQLFGLNFYWAYHGRSDLELNRLMCQALRKHAPTLNYKRKSNAPMAKKKRVGVFSTNLREHTIGRLFGELFCRLDRERFSPIFIYEEGVEDRSIRRFRESMDEHCSVPRRLNAARARIELLNLDLLHFPDIGMDNLTTFVSMSRLATVQSVTWGHPCTTGIDTIDAFISAKNLNAISDTPEFSERLIIQETPNIYFKPPNLIAPLNKDQLGLPAGKLYGCLQSLFKFHPDFDSILRSLLNRDPSAHLILLEGIHSYWKELFLKRLTHDNAALRKRIHWVPTVDRPHFLAILKCMDVVLDPMPFGGGNTILEALSLSIPTITLPGQYTKGRLALLFLKRLGLEQTIATTPENYVDLALEYAHNKHKRSTWIQQLNQTKSKLFANSKSLTDFEDALETACSIQIR